MTLDQTEHAIVIYSDTAINLNQFRLVFRLLTRAQNYLFIVMLYTSRRIYTAVRDGCIHCRTKLHG